MKESERSPRTVSESEQRLQSLFEHNPEAVFSLDREGRFIGLNPASERTSGFAIGELLGRSFLPLIVPEDRERAIESFRRALAGEVRELELAIRHRDGHRIDLLTRSLPIFVDGKVVGVYGVAQDITARKKAESALRASERRYRQVLEAMHLLGLILDCDGRVTFCNDFFCRFTGYERDKVLGQDACSLLLPGERQAEMRARLRCGVEAGEMERMEHEVVLATGRRPLVAWQYVLVPDHSGRVCCVTCIGEDVTERRREEARLVRALKRERRIAESLQESLLLTPPPESLPGLEVESIYMPALEEARIGGDFYDAIPLPDGRVALAVGDAAGKGLAAATRTAEVKYVLRAYLRERPDPADALARLNTFVLQAETLEGRSEDSFLTVALVVVDSRTGEATYAAAGAGPPLFLGADAACERGVCDGLPIGVLPQGGYTNGRRTLAPGDIVLLVTDGIPEARQGRQFYGYERMEIAAREAALVSGSLRLLGEAVLSDARRFARGHLHDDACLLLARLA